MACQSGEIEIVDDYRLAYGFLREETPHDARVMAWWDYGYQITGVGNRTTIADGVSSQTCFCLELHSCPVLE